MQSPISIEENFTLQRNYTSLYFLNYNQPFDALITYTEEGINIKFLFENIIPSVFGGGLFKEYLLTELDLHWDSEHKINNQRYALEAQLIHYAKEYETLANAKNYKDGICILSTLFRTSIHPNLAIDNLTAAIPEIKIKIEQQVPLLQKIIPRDFLAPRIANYFRYKGSFTKPKYDETVIWTVFLVPSIIEASQFEKLTHIWHKLKKSDKNGRQEQDLNERKIYFRKIKE